MGFSSRHLDNAIRRFRPCHLTKPRSRPQKQRKCNCPRLCCPRSLPPHSLHVLCSTYLGPSASLYVEWYGFSPSDRPFQVFSKSDLASPGPLRISGNFFKLHDNIRHEAEGLRIPSDVHDAFAFRLVFVKAQRHLPPFPPHRVQPRLEVTIRI
ncbi:hypothetical protein B0H14DRAFT_2705911 [Mycena olivaceomarginata]|nr:hypothetical protein B0H14DRAFT_2705911 [Mycena olivaceomarginata]